MRRPGLALLGAAAISAAFLPSVASAAESDLLLEVQARFKATRKWFGMVSDLPWDRAADGTLAAQTGALKSPFVLKHDAAGQSLDARLPPDASRPLRVELRAVPGFWVRTQERDVPPVKAEILRGMVVYPGVFAGGDLLYKLTPTHLDEYLYLRTPPARLSRTFEFDVGPAVSQARQAGERVELVGKDGIARLRMSAPLARAADGTRRLGTIRVKERTLVEEIDLSGLAAPVLVDPDWTTTGTMAVAHWADGVLRRPDDRVMVVGGCALAACPPSFAESACSQLIASSDVWDRKSGTWTSGPALSTARYSFAYAPLPGGDMLVAGGCTETGCTQTTALAERYVFQSSTWAPAGALDGPRANAMAAVLAGDDVLVAGGCAPGGCTPSAQRYTPAANGWSPAAPLASPRGFATATTLADGRVLVVGGCGTPDCSSVLDDAIAYDRVANTWTSAGKMAAPRAGHTATLLGDGTVLVAGGCTDALCKTTLDSVELWTSGAGFAPGPTMAGARHNHSATPLLGGAVLIAGGGDPRGATVPTSEAYFPLAKQWVKPGSMLQGRAYHVAAALAGGDVLVAGGCNPQTCLPWAEVFSPASLPIDSDAGLIFDGGAMEGGTLARDAGPVHAPRSPHPLPYRSGHTTCATDDTQDLPCPVAGWPLQDGEYQPNAKPFEVVSAAEVRDPVTGLLWQANDGGGTYTKAEAIAHCADLGTAGAPQGSWRLPTVVELSSLVNYGINNPSIDPKFAGTLPTNYWTSSSLAATRSLAWAVKFDFGEIIPLLDGTKLPARCVSGQSALLGTTRRGGPLTVAGDTVRDERSGLEWQRRDEGTKYGWGDALAYCAGLSLADHDDWHLPNVAELDSIVEYGGAPGDVKIDPAFQNTAGDIYWTSSQNEGVPTLSWSITFNLGVIDGVTTSGLGRVRCVRHLADKRSLSGGGCGCTAGPADVLGGAPVLLAPAVALVLRRRRRRPRP